MRPVRRNRVRPRHDRGGGDAWLRLRPITFLAGATTVGITLIVSSAATMVIAAASLIIADPCKARVPGLFAQALPPAVGLVGLVLN